MTVLTLDIADQIVQEQGQNITIPDTYTSIKNGAFDSDWYSYGEGNRSHWNIQSVVIPDSITSIGDWAFFDNSLTSVDIPDSVTYIGTEAFAYNNLTSVTIPDSVTSVGEEAFIDNNLTSAYIGDNATIIGKNAFAKNLDLETISISSEAPWSIRASFPYWSEIVVREADEKVAAENNSSQQNTAIDIITGTSGKDKLKGKKSSVHLKGLGGKDKLIGSRKDDILDGGDGNDVLTGKKGADAYVLSSGKDKFKGFKLKEGDTIQIDSDIKYSLVQSKTNTLIKHDDGVTTVFNVNKDELTSVIELVT